MSFVQIIYEDGDPNELSEGSNLAPILLDNPNVIGVENIEEDEVIGVNSRNAIVTDDTEALLNNTIRDIKYLGGVEWDNRETNYLLKKYNKYILSIGPRKKFRTKKDMWRRISQDMKNDMNINRSSFQCENRYKTVLRKWRKSTRKEIKEDENESSVLINHSTSNDKVSLVSSNPNVLSWKQNSTNIMNDSSCQSNHEENKKKKDLAEVLWEIFRKKEENKERRHREKMELIKKLIQLNQ